MIRELERSIHTARAYLTAWKDGERPYPIHAGRTIVIWPHGMAEVPSNG